MEQDNVDLEVKNDEDLPVDDTTLLEKDQDLKEVESPTLNQAKPVADVNEVSL